MVLKYRCQHSVNSKHSKSEPARFTVALPNTTDFRTDEKAAVFGNRRRKPKEVIYNQENRRWYSTLLKGEGRGES